MSKFSINNPAFLSMAGNVLSNSGVGTFYIEAIEDNTTISFIFQPFTSISTDDIEYVSAPDSKVLNAGEKIFIKFDTITEMTGSNPFTVDKEFNAGGNCPILNFVVDMDGETMSAYLPIIFSSSLIKDASNMVIDIESKTLTRGLSFKNCDKLILPPKLTAKTLSAKVYYEMFKGCTSLTTAPELPATTLAGNCYKSMFEGCTSLTTAPELPATTLAESCYLSMFRGCTSLTIAPGLPATTLAGYCYEMMFEGCTSLTTAPELPATILAECCYNAMFERCALLTTAPELPATILTDYCYKSMFAQCTKLVKITCLSTTNNATDATDDWVYGVSPTGTFIKAAGVEWTTGVDGIPEGWTAQEYAG